MSIIIQIGGTSLTAADAVVPAPACIVETTTDMGPGLEHENEISLMPEENVTVSVYSPVKSAGSQARVSKANHSSSSLGYANCFGLPYQDHNYGAPPPPTPPQSPPPPPKVNGLIDDDTSLSVISTPSTNNEEEQQEESVTRCICGFDHDDEYMICCDKCFVWQHVDCMGLDRSSIPEMYMCEKCSPRKVDRQKAKALQARKKGKLRAFNSEIKTCCLEATSEETKEEEETPGRRIKHAKSKKAETKYDQVHNKKVKAVKQPTREKAETKKKVQRRVRRNRRESTNNADEEAQDAWESSLREWIDKYENALINQYTPEVQLLTGSLKINGHHEELVRKVSEQLQSKLCKVGMSSDNRKLLLAAQDMKGEQAIVEYRGKFLSVSQFREKNPVFNRRLYPFVLFYKPQNDEEDVCVDAREYGNEARFVRRSCTPNAIVRHVIQNGLIHLYLFSCKDIKKDEEITIPFDYQESGSDPDCACGKTTCPLLSPNIKTENPEPSPEKRRKRTKSGCNHHEEESSQSTPAKQTTVKSETCQNENSNPNVTSSVETNPTEVKTTSEERETEEQAAERRKKMTREERKIDAIMRAFERMEKTAKRRQQALERMAQLRAQNQKATSEGDSGDKLDEPHEENSCSNAPIKQEVAEPKVEVVSPPEPSPGEEKPASAPPPPPPPPPPTSTSPAAVSPQAPALPQTSRHRKGRRRRGSCSMSRKRIRTNSGSSDIMSPDEGFTTSVLQVQATPHASSNGSAAPAVAAVVVPPPVPIPNSVPCPAPAAEPTEPLVAALVATVATPSCTSGSTKLPKTKRILMHEWLQEKAEAATASSTAATSPNVTQAPSIATSPVPVQTEIPVDSAVPNANCFVRCTRDNPSGGISAAHLRRNTISQPHSGKSTSLGSAKKRWLRQAMCENETPDAEGSYSDILESEQASSPLHTECSSPSPHTCDIVTPLKKRRLIRESTESALSPGAVSPSPSMGDLVGSVQSVGSPSPSIPMEHSPLELPSVRGLIMEEDVPVVSSSMSGPETILCDAEHPRNKVEDKRLSLTKEVESDTCNTLDSLPEEPPTVSESCQQDPFIPQPSSYPGGEADASRDAETKQSVQEAPQSTDTLTLCDNVETKSDKEPDSSTNDCAASSSSSSSSTEALLKHENLTKVKVSSSPSSELSASYCKASREVTEDPQQVCDSMGSEVAPPCHSSTHPSMESAATSTLELLKQPIVTNCCDTPVDSTVQLRIKSQDDLCAKTDAGVSPTQSHCAESCNSTTVCDSAVTSTPLVLCSVSSTTPVCSNGTVGTGQKRKVSLNEYRMRMKDSANGRNSDSSKASSKPPVTSCSSDSNECTPKLSLLPIFESNRTSSTSKSSSSSSSQSESKDSGKENPASDEEGKWSSSSVAAATTTTHLDSVPEQRESLSQRLRREFGVIDDDSDTDDPKGKHQAHPTGILQPPQNIPVAVAFNVGQPPPPPMPVVTGNSQLKAAPHFAYSAIQPYPTQAFLATQLAPPPPHFITQPAPPPPQGQHVPILSSPQLSSMPAVAGSRAVPVPGRPQTFPATSAPPPPPPPPPGTLNPHHHHHNSPATPAHTNYTVVGNITPNFVTHHPSPTTPQPSFQNHYRPTYFK